MDTRKSKILVVEDEYIVAEDLSALLHRLGYDVTDICATGKAVVEAVLSNAPDLILMDIKLQGPQDGVQTAQQLRTMCDIPVIYVTALTDDDTLYRAKITEPFGYIIKPFEEREIHSSIEITLYKHAMDMKLRARDAWHRRALCSLHEGVITSDAEGRVTFLNPRAEQLTGWSSADAAGKSLADVLTIVDDSTRARMDSPLERVLHDTVVVGDSNHRLLISRDGKDIPIEESVAPVINDRGEIIGTVLLFRDVTVRKRSEVEVLRHCHELKNIMHRKDRVFDILSSNDGSPSNILLNICDAILAAAGNVVPDDAVDCSTSASDACARPASASETALSGGHAARKYISLHMEDVNLFEKTEAALAACGEQIRERFIRVDNRIGKNPSVRANPKMIRAIVSGVLSDAIANTVLNGELVLRCTRDARGTELSVDFTGTTNAIAESPGLRTCRELVEMQGGTLAIDERSSTSRCIRFTVPDEQPAG